MPTPKIPDALLLEAVTALAQAGGNETKAADALGMSRGTLQNRLRMAKIRGVMPRAASADAKDAAVDASKLRIVTRELEEARRELIAERERLRVFEAAAGRVHVPKWLKSPRAAGKERAIATAFLSDTHFDEVVRPEEINHVNSYSRSIAEARLRKFFESVAMLGAHYINGIAIDGVVLALGGDMVSGNIHEELEISNEAPILDTVLHWSGQLAAGIRMLVERFGTVHVPCVVGNHGRIRQRIRFKGRARDSYDWLIYNIVARELAGVKEVTFDISDSTEARWDSYSTRYQLSHGDQFRGGSGIAGIMTPILLGDHRKRSREQATNTPYDVLLLGHWHQLKDLGRVIVNGSLKGYDEYAWGNNFGFEPAQQAFWLTDPKHGKTIFAPVHVVSDSEGWQRPAAAKKVVTR